MNYVRVGGYIPPQPIEDYNDLPNIPVQNQDLAVSGFTPVANSYYRHIGETTASFTNGVIYLYNGTGYAALDGAAVNNGTLTIQKNGTNVATFGANQSSSVTANITVPTKASDVNALPISGGELTGGISAPNISTGTAAANYFQSQKFRGEGNADTYYHAVDFGYAGHNQVDFHEYGGVYNFHQNTVGTSDGGVLVGAFTPDGIKEGNQLLKDKYLGKSGGTITGNLTVGGNLTVNGTTTTVDSTTLQVKDKLIEVAHGNTTTLTTPAGLVAPKYDGTNSGALVFDSTGTAYVGDVTLKDGNIDVANSDLQPLATRTGLVGGNLVQYDSSAQTLKDAGKKISDLVTTNTTQTISGSKTFTREVKFGSTENFQGYYIKRMLGSLGAGTAYNNLDPSYKDGNWHRMWRLRFPSGSNFWGKIKVTLYGGYSSFNASGVMSKSITCNFNTSSIYNNVGCYDGLGVNVEQDFRISEAIWNATVSAWEVLIWQQHLNGNNSPVIMLECWTENNTNYINAFNGITAQTVELTQSTSYSAQKASPTGGTKTVTWATLPVYENPLGEEIATTGGNTFSGLQTINAPTNVSGSEQTTMKVKTSNGGAIIFGKEGPNDGTMIRLDQTDGTCRLRFRSSNTAGAMVWEQPEHGAKLHVDLGKDGSDKHRVTFPSSSGTLALTSQIKNGTLTIQKNGTKVQTFTANQSSNATANITVPTKVSELTNDSGYTTNKGTVTSVSVKMNGASKGTVTSSGTIDLGTVITAHQDISGKANLSGGNTFTGKQTLNSPPSDGYSINAAGYIKGSWLQSSATSNKGSGTGKVCVFDNNNWIYYRTPAEILTEAGGAKASDIPKLQWVVPTSVSEILNAIMWQVTGEFTNTPQYYVSGSGVSSEAAVSVTDTSDQYMAACSLFIASDGTLTLSGVMQNNSDLNKTKSIDLSKWKILKYA